MPLCILLPLPLPPPYHCIMHHLIHLLMPYKPCYHLLPSSCMSCCHCGYLLYLVSTITLCISLPLLCQALHNYQCCCFLHLVSITLHTLFPLLLLPCAPHCHCLMHFIAIAPYTLSLLPCTPCYCCPYHPAYLIAFALCISLATLMPAPAQLQHNAYSIHSFKIMIGCATYCQCPQKTFSNCLVSMPGLTHFSGPQQAQQQQLVYISSLCIYFQVQSLNNNYLVLAITVTVYTLTPSSHFAHHAPIFLCTPCLLKLLSQPYNMLLPMVI